MNRTSPVSVFLWLLLSTACSSSGFLTREFTETEKEFKDHTGFVLYDPTNRKTIFNYKGDRYFTPASNTKIFTFYTSLMLLPDSIPALHYVIRGDSLTFWGTGDPSLFYGEAAHNDRVLNFLRNRPEKLFFSHSNFQTDHFGQGWAWDDYLYAYQVERSSLPLYGNRFTVTKNGQEIRTVPAHFSQSVSVSDHMLEKSEVVRHIGSNDLKFTRGTKGKPDHWEIPFHDSPELSIQLLSDTLRRSVTLSQLPVPLLKSTLYSVPSDSLYKVMMQESDNFIAEQLLLVCADILSDTLKPEIAIREGKKRFLNDLPDEPIWMDGSGLSRYNLFTPASIVSLWEKIYEKVPGERLFSLLARGGETGTIKNYYKLEKPYIFGKTGTLSNNHSLSGYLVTKKGTTLIFCWMNSNFTVPNSKVRGRMEEVLKKIYERY